MTSDPLSAWPPVDMWDRDVVPDYNEDQDPDDLSDCVFELYAFIASNETGTYDPYTSGCVRLSASQRVFVCVCWVTRGVLTVWLSVASSKSKSHGQTRDPIPTFSSFRPPAMRSLT